MKSTTDVPPVGNRKKDAVSLLTADHQTLLRYFDEILEPADDPAARRRRADLVAQITNLMKLHLEVENTIFYPAATGRIRDESVAIESSFEQDDEQYVIEQLEALSSEDPHYDDKVASLCEQFREHVQEEETEIFPRFLAAKIDMDALGIKIRRRQRGLG